MERFYEYFAPTHYDLNLSITNRKTKIHGRVEISGEVKAKTIKLHAVDMEISELVIDDKVTEYEQKDGALIIKNQELGEHRIEIEFTSEIKENMESAYLSKYVADGEEHLIVATQFESHYARQCFPCIDEPSAKATFSLKIASIQTDTILSNMPPKFSLTQDGRKTVEFEETPRMSTYLLAFVVGDFVAYETESKHGVKITSYAGIHQPVEDLKHSANFAAEVLDFYDDLFKTPFPLPKLDLVALPDFEAGAMENWGLTAYREIAMLANEKSAIDQKLYVDLVIAHELSHMWFGDLVTMAWWDDLWLNESFANMIETYAVDKLHPELDAWDDFYTSAVLLALRRDCLPDVQPVKVDVKNVNEIENLFDGAIVYSKGSRLLLMLMRTMGEKAFFAGLADYFKKHAYSNTTADDLWDALTPHADFDVKKFMTPWLTQSGYPVVTGKQQQRFLLSMKTDDSKYPIRELRDDLSGHYLINLSDEELAEKIRNFASLNKEQKLRLLIDRRLLAKTKMVSSASLLSLLQEYSQETDTVIWEVISATIGDLKIFFEKNTPEEQEFKSFVSKLVDGNYKRLGVSVRVNESADDTRLRPVILSLKRYAGDDEFFDRVVRTYRDVDINNINTNLRWVVMAVLCNRNSELAATYFDTYKTSSDVALKSDIMDAITLTKDRNLCGEYLKSIQSGAIRPQDRLFFFVRLVRNRYLHDDTLAWFYANWDWLKDVEGNKTAPDYPRYIAGAIIRPGDAQQYKEFFKQYIKDAAFGRNITIAFSEIDATLRLIEEDRAAVFEALVKLK